MADDELLAFRDGDRWGYRDAAGRTVIAPLFQSAGSFSEGLARVRVARLWGYVDTRGEITITPQFEQARAFNKGVAKVKKHGTWVLIDMQGKIQDSLTSQSYLDDRGGFVSEAEYRDWEKPAQNEEDK